MKSEAVLVRGGIDGGEVVIVGEELELAKDGEKASG